MMMRKLKGMADAAGISLSYGPMFSTCKFHLQLACSSISPGEQIPLMNDFHIEYINEMSKLFTFINQCLSSYTADSLSCLS